jgi:hypothetical protein
MSEIISGSFSDYKKRIASPALRDIVAYWDKARKNAAMPAWEDMSPSELAPHLKLLWFWNYDRATKEFTARLASNRVMQGYQKSFRGTPLKELHSPHMAELSQAHMTKVLSDPAAYYCNGKLFKVDTLIVEGERIMLPLASDRIHGDVVLGATDFPMRPAQGPIELLVGDISWFSL